MCSVCEEIWWLEVLHYGEKEVSQLPFLLANIRRRRALLSGTSETPDYRSSCVRRQVSMSYTGLQLSPCFHLHFLLNFLLPVVSILRHLNFWWARCFPYLLKPRSLLFWARALTQGTLSQFPYSRNVLKYLVLNGPTIFF